MVMTGLILCSFLSTIAEEKGIEITYNGVPIEETIGTASEMFADAVEENVGTAIEGINSVLNEFAKGFTESLGMIEDTIHNIYPGIGVSPYTMTGGTDAKFYSDVCKNAIRFAPLYIDEQQYGSIHGLNENIYQGTLPMGVDFYKEVIKRS